MSWRSFIGHTATMSDATTTEETTDGLSWIQALLYAVLITAICLAFAVFWEVVARAITDF